MSIGERISDLRRKKDISQYQLSKILGVSRQAVSKWENDQSSPDTLNLIRLADILDTQVEYLATGKTLPLSPSSPLERIVEVEKVVEVEKIVEKTVTVEKPVYIEKVVNIDKIVEKPIIRKVIRYKYTRNPLEFILIGALCFAAGLVFGFLIL